MRAEEAIDVGKQVLDRGVAIARKIDEIIEQDAIVADKREQLKEIKERPGPEQPVTFDNPTHYSAYLLQKEKRQAEISEAGGHVHEEVKRRQRLATALTFDRNLLSMEEGQVVRLRHTYGGEWAGLDGTYLVQAKITDVEEGVAEVGCWLS